MGHKTKVQSIKRKNSEQFYINFPMDKQLIYREDALEIVRRTSGDYAAAFAEISRLPVVDAVQVTRCRDCDGRRAEISARVAERNLSGIVDAANPFCCLLLLFAQDVCKKLQSCAVQQSI